jgi:hypothetical protein
MTFLDEKQGRFTYNDVELAFPIKDKSKIHLVSKDDNEPVEGTNPHKIISEFRTLVEIPKKGLQIDIFTMKQKTDGEVSSYLYWNPDTVVSRYLLSAANSS